MYRTIKQLLSNTPTAAEEADMQELRKWLDDTLEYQASDAPPMPLTYAHYPAREGWLLDLLFERERNKEIDEAERLKDIGDIEGMTEEMTDMMEEMELDDDRTPLEDDEAVRAADAEVFGEDVNIP